jgi:predicted dehydrogenase
MSREVGIGLVGYGGIGRLHALCFRMMPLCYPGLPAPVRLAAVDTASSASAERARRELGSGVFVTTDLDALLRHPGVTAVDCCAPTGEHARVASAALRAGKALLCEKPLASNTAEAEELVALARQQGLPGALNFHFRHVPALQEARRRVEAGLLGDVIGFHLRYYRASNLKRDRPLTWRFAGPGSGVLVDLGSHMVDLVLHLLGPVVRVRARTRILVPERPGPDGRPTPVQADDAAWLELELAGGGVGTVEVSKMVPGAGDDVRIEAWGTRGAFTFDTTDPNGLHLVESAEAPVGSRRVATLSRTLPAASLPGAEMASGWVQWHLASLASQVEALGAGTPPQPGLEHGLRVDRILEAARQAAAQDGAVHVAP